MSKLSAVVGVSLRFGIRFRSPHIRAFALLKRKDGFEPRRWLCVLAGKYLSALPEFIKVQLFGVTHGGVWDIIFHAKILRNCGHVAFHGDPLTACSR